MAIRDFIKRHYHHFNAGALADCAESLNEFLDNDDDNSVEDVIGSVKKNKEEN